MDPNEHLRDVRAELAGSKLTRAERADAEAQIAGAAGAVAAAASDTARAASQAPAATKNRPPTVDPTVEAAVSAIESRQAPPPGPAPVGAPTGPTTVPISAPRSGDTAKDPVRELVNQLVALTPQIAGSDSRLAQAVRLLQESAQQGKTSGAQFQTKLAYALQDAERIVGPLANIPQGLRHQMTLLATTQHGLHNERLQALLSDTPNIADASLVRAIRSSADTVSGQRDQHSEAIMERVDKLIGRAQQALRVGAAENPWVGPTPTAATAQQTRAPDAGANPEMTTTAQIDTPRPATRLPQEAIVAHQATGPRALGSIFRALRDPAAPAREPWDTPPSPLGPRISAFAARFAARNEERQLAETERAGRAALDALRQFSQSTGASVLNKIRDAARTEPDGFHGVMAQMRDGGKYADLRERFNAALATERGLGAAYDRAAGALSHYGAQRTAADAIISRRPDAAALNGRFEQIDAELGQAASAIPGRTDGKSALDEVADKAREIMTKAVDAVRSMFGRTAGATAQATASPSAAPVP